MNITVDQWKFSSLLILPCSGVTWINIFQSPIGLQNVQLLAAQQGPGPRTLKPFLYFETLYFQIFEYSCSKIVFKPLEKYCTYRLLESAVIMVAISTGGKFNCLITFLVMCSWWIVEYRISAVTTHLVIRTSYSQLHLR